LTIARRFQRPENRKSGRVPEARLNFSHRLFNRVFEPSFTSRLASA